MEVEEGYYTPTIDQFVDGFEYEYYGDRVNRSRWHKTIHNKGSFPISAIMVRIRNEGFHANMIRAKIIDVQDDELMITDQKVI